VNVTIKTKRPIAPEPSQKATTVHSEQTKLKAVSHPLVRDDHRQLRQRSVNNLRLEAHGKRSDATHTIKPRMEIDAVAQTMVCNRNKRLPVK